jgi:hypothetical protein
MTLNRNIIDISPRAPLPRIIKMNLITVSILSKIFTGLLPVIPNIIDPKKTLQVIFILQTKRVLSKAR